MIYRMGLIGDVQKGLGRVVWRNAGAESSQYHNADDEWPLHVRKWQRPYDWGADSSFREEEVEIFEVMSIS